MNLWEYSLIIKGISGKYLKKCLNFPFLGKYINVRKNIFKSNGDIQPYIGKKRIREVYIYELDLKVGDRMKVILIIAIGMLVGEIIEL